MNRELFLKVPFLNTCDVQQIRIILPCIRREYYWPGNAVCREGEAGRGLYLVGRGFVKTTRHGSLLSLLTHTDFFGEASLLSEEKLDFTAETVTLCQFMVLDRAEFDDVQDLYPQMKKTLRRYASNKARQGKGALAGMANFSAVKRIKVEFENSRHLLSREGISALHADIAAWEQSILNEMRASLPQKRGSQSGRGRVAPRQAPPPGPM